MEHHHPTNSTFKRPFVITSICILGFISAGLSVIMLSSFKVVEMDAWFRPYAGMATAISLVWLLGLWNSKRWAFQVYSGFIVINQLVLLATGHWHFIVMVSHGSIFLLIAYHISPSINNGLVAMTNYMKRKIWTVIVAYMLGLHNIYREEEKTPEDISLKINILDEHDYDEGR